MLIVETAESWFILLFVLITNNQQNQQNQQGFTHPIVSELNRFTLLLVEPAESARFYTPYSYRVEWIYFAYSGNSRTSRISKVLHTP